MKKRYIVVALCIFFVILLTILVCTNNIKPFDDIVYDLVYGNHNKILDTFFIHYTKLADTIPTLIISIIIILLLNRKDQICFGTSLISTVGMNQLMKHIIRRPRPPLERRLITQGGYSFPSGHSMVSLCIYGILIYFVITKIKNKSLKLFLTILLTIVILLIGISRIYVGVHYPSDVLGGFLCSIAIIIVDITITNHYLEGE